MTAVVPRIQARIRGMCQRTKYAEVTHHMFLVKKAMKIQSKWRMFVAYHVRLRKIKEIKFAQHQYNCATNVQRVYRGIVGRRRVIDARNKVLNEKIKEARVVSKEEQNAIVIQRTVTAWLARLRAVRIIEQRAIEKARRALEERMMRTVQVSLSLF